MLKQIAWTLLKPLFESWLSARALVIPEADVAALAAKEKVPVEVVMAVNQAVIGLVVTKIDTFKP